MVSNAIHFLNKTNSRPLCCCLSQQFATMKENVNDERKCQGQLCKKLVIAMALYRIMIYRLYRYFGYDIVEDVSNQRYRLTRYVSTVWP